jgi:hypothetical protein
MLNHKICTTGRRAQFWNVGDLGGQHEFLDDAGLRARTCNPLWSASIIETGPLFLY